MNFGFVWSKHQTSDTVYATVATRFQHYSSSAAYPYRKVVAIAISGLGVNNRLQCAWQATFHPPFEQFGSTGAFALACGARRRSYKIMWEVGHTAHPLHEGPNPWGHQFLNVLWFWWWSMVMIIPVPWFLDSSCPWPRSTELCIPMTSKWVLIYMQG